MIVQLLLVLTAVYIGTGFVFAIVFIFKGIESVDESARGATIGFKIIIIPGLMLCWSVLLKKWLIASKKRPHE